MARALALALTLTPTFTAVGIAPRCLATALPANLFLLPRYSGLTVPPTLASARHWLTLALGASASVCACSLAGTACPASAPASRAHAAMLGRAGILSEADARAIDEGLNAVGLEIAAGKWDRAWVDEALDKL